MQNTSINNFDGFLSFLWRQKQYFGKNLYRSKWLPCSIPTNYCVQPTEKNETLMCCMQPYLSHSPHSHRISVCVLLQWTVPVCRIPAKTMYYSTNASFIRLTYFTHQQNWPNLSHWHTRACIQLSCVFENSPLIYLLSS